jgi:DNA-binding NarL/FixJ family response regulator
MDTITRTNGGTSATWSDAVAPATLDVLFVGRPDMYLDGVAELLRSEALIGDISVATTLDDGVRSARMRAPGVIVVHVGDFAADREPVDVVRRLQGCGSEAGIIAILPLPDPIVARSLVAAGISGCLTERSRSADLFEAVRRASDGEHYLAPCVAMALARLGERNGSRDLTLRESEVLRLIACGYTNREIATKVHLSVRTVEAHRSRLSAKLGVRRRADLVRAALDAGLLG